MIPNHIILVETDGMQREDWLAYRKRGLGASEVGTVLGLDPYKSSIELYYEKIGQVQKGHFENLAMFLGKELEDFISNLWQYWDGTTETMIENYRSGRKQRECHKVDAYAHNPSHGHLFASLDRYIPPVNAGQGGGSLEIKTMSGFVSRQWDAGIPPQYVVQLQTQLLVCELQWGEIVVLEDNRKFDVIPFERNDGICETIIERTRAFWRKVMEGRELNERLLQHQTEGDFQRAAQCQADIDALAPEPDNSEAYNEFLNNRYQTPTRSELMGSIEQYDIALKHRQLGERIAEIEKERLLYENQLKSAIGEYEVLNFQQDGKVTWLANKKGVRTFRNQVKG